MHIFGTFVRSYQECAAYSKILTFWCDPWIMKIEPVTARDHAEVMKGLP
jgi:hypothetical protein